MTAKELDGIVVTRPSNNSAYYKLHYQKDQNGEICFEWTRVLISSTTVDSAKLNINSAKFYYLDSKGRNYSYEKSLSLIENKWTEIYPGYRCSECLGPRQEENDYICHECREALHS